MTLGRSVVGTVIVLEGITMEEADDWIIDSNGFYIATRSFLIRRGYCCANQCLNCPYINWRNSPTWKPLDASMIHIAKVSPKAIEGARKMLTLHESQSEEALHPQMIAHYRLLLERWEEASD